MTFKDLRTIFLAAAMAMSSGASAAPAQVPLFLVKSATPMTLFAMSVDHQLFMKAFADYSDLNGDGRIDNTYTDTFDYYGYFDSARCYSYDATNNYFRPRNAANGTNGHRCANSSSNGDWSGNFLNWATMTRIDVLRKALYGGKRIVDSTSQTVLERAILPFDVHSFVKVFTPAPGENIADYLPTSFNGAGTVSLCSSTPPPTSGSDVTSSMNTATNHPKVRVASGNWGRWAADEVYQCEWRNNGVSPGTAQNLFSSGSSAAPSVRVEVCVSGSLEANCQIYSNVTAAKPTGLLQEYGEDGSLRFGLMSGSYQKRDEGGVLRKGIGYLTGNAAPADDEINLSNGTFNTSVNGIIASLNKIRLNQWDYSDRKYLDCAIFGIPTSAYLSAAQTHTYGGTAYDATCSNWGNPISELYLEAVRYMIGESSPTTAFNVTSDSLGLPTATWTSSTDPMPAEEWCSPMNVVVIASGDNSFDTDALGTVPTVLGNINDATDLIGTQESLSGNVFIGEVGATPATTPDNNTCSAKAFTNLSQLRGLCPATPAKQGGYAVAGIAYKSHTTDLRTDRINDPLTGDGQTINTFAIAMAKNLPDFEFRIGTNRVKVVPNGYASFAGSTPPANHTSWRASSLAQLNVESTEYDAGGNLVYARFLAHWEDSAWGNDYDMDVISRVSICVGSACAAHDDDGSGANDTDPGAGVMRVTTRAIHAASGAAMKVGFVISGTTSDGEYTNLIKPWGGNYTSFDDDPGRDASEPTPTTYTFAAGASGAKLLPSPLQYAAKYGAFKDSNNNNQPDIATEWDEDGDGVADSYFFADDPSLIGPKLASYLSTIVTTSSASAVVANSVSFQSSTRIYQARFDSSDWSGQLLSFPIRASDAAILTPDWDSATLLAAQNHDTGREVFTWDPVNGAGIAFRWNSLVAAQQALLNINPATTTADALGDERLDYLRGDRSNELANGGPFRDRTSLLGDNVNSSPAVVGAPGYGYVDTLETVPYSNFVASYDDVECYQSDGTTLRSVLSLEREPMVYFGANDGMLHGVSACTGQERLAYVPNALMASLPQLSSPNYSHRYYVDGAPTVVDAFWSGAWHTMLVGSTRAGGKAVFALDVTNPSTFDEANAATKVLWEISDTTTGFADLGYTYSQPIVVKAKGHGWVSIFGNGYSSASGKAVLYVVDADDGGLQDALVLDNTTGNGLSSVAPIDTDNDGEVDLLYVGDLKGNLWRLEAGNSGFTTSRVSLLYAARSASNVPQPITTRPDAGYHPISNDGRMVFFGTGKYFESVDGDPNQAVQYNTMYGIWDRDTGSTITSVTTRNSNILQQQTITTQTAATFGSNNVDVRIVSDTPITWVTKQNNNSWNSCAANASCGWYLDMTNNNVRGEKIVANPVLRGGRLIFVTVIPSLSSCDAGGDSWLMEINADTGGRIDKPVFDLDGDHLFDYDDMRATSDANGNTVYTPPSGKKSKVGILQPPAIVAGVGGSGTGEFGRAEAKYSSGSKGGVIDTTIEDTGLPSQGRKSWMQYQ